MAELEKPRTLLFVDPNAIHDYVPKAYRDLPADQQPVFQIRTLTHGIYEMRRDMLSRTSDGGMTMAMGSWIVLALRHGLRGSKGPNVPPVTFDSDGTVTDAYLDSMSAPLRSEIANAIERLCTVGPTALFG